jgi:hypothetical protein
MSPPTVERSIILWTEKGKAKMLRGLDRQLDIPVSCGAGVFFTQMYANHHMRPRRLEHPPLGQFMQRGQHFRGGGSRGVSAATSSSALIQPSFRCEDNVWICPTDFPGS